jgi:hypothetical protein
MTTNMNEMFKMGLVKDCNSIVGGVKVNKMEVSQGGYSKLD